MISATTAADAITTKHDLQATPVVTSPYVALGDSYSSGAGIMPLVASASAGPCNRSQLNFAEDIAASSHPASFTDVTCSGATTADFFTPQQQSTTVQSPIAPPQLDAVHSDTRLVTMTIGGNDDGAFVASFFGCPTIDALDPTGHKCMTKYGTTYTDQINNDTYPNVVHALTAVRNKAPLATVVILGYPQILPPTGSQACYAATGISEGDVPWLYNQQMVLNDAVRRAAGVTGARYVDTFTPSAGHDACALTDRWMEPLVGPVNALPDHPNAIGEAAMAREALAVISTTQSGGPNSAFGLSATGLTNVGPISVSNYPTGPATSNVASVQFPPPPVSVLSTGVLQTTSAQTGATAEVATVRLRNPGGVESLTADAVKSQCDVDPTTGKVSGSASIVNGTSTGFDVAPALVASPPANTPISLGALGSVVLNRQTTDPAGVLTVDAAYISLFPTNTEAAQVITIASTTCTPAASTATTPPTTAPTSSVAASAPSVGASAPALAVAPQVRFPVGGVNTGGGPRPTSSIDSPVLGVVGGLLLSSGIGLGFGAYRRRLAGQK